jgi:RNase H-like domain found in reverse transcriptase
LRGFLAKLIVLAFPDFTLPFDICTDASKIQIGAVIYQKNRPLDILVLCLSLLNLTFSFLQTPDVFVSCGLFLLEAGISGLTLFNPV